MKYSPYSYSKLKAYIDCPQKFDLCYIQGIKIKPDNIAIQIGSCFHAFMNSYTKQILNTGDKASDGIWAIISGDNKQPYEESIKKEAQKLWRWYEKEFLAVLALDAKLIPEEEICIDSNYNRVDWWDKNGFMRAKIDRIDSTFGNIKIIDYKTGWTKDNDVFQGQIYAWLLSKISKVMDIFAITMTVCFMNVRHREADEYSVTQDDLKEINAKIFSIVSAIENDTEFKSRTGDHCSHCDYLQHCKSSRGALETIHSDFPIMNPENAVRIAKLIPLAEAKIKELKGKIKEWAIMHGPIDIGSGSWTISQNENITIDPQKFHETATGLGVNPFDFMSVSNQKLKAKKHEYIRDAVAEFTVYDKGAETFTIKKNEVKNEGEEV